MYEVVYMLADFEPWWMFEEWEEYVQKRTTFSTLDEAEAYFEEQMTRYANQHESSERRKYAFAAFWTKGEQCFCDHCDEDLQMYHGLILLVEGKPYIKQE